MLAYTTRTKLNRILWLSIIAGFIYLMMTDNVLYALAVGLVLSVLIPTLLANIILHNVQRRDPAKRRPEHKDLAPNWWRDDLMA